MNYHMMEYCELKQEAKAKRIKMYYVMRKAQLIELLCMKTLPEKYRVEKMRIGELKEQARARGFLAVYKLCRQQLVELLYPHLCRKDMDKLVEKGV
jgi:hypothetical protein